MLKGAGILAGLVLALPLCGCEDIGHATSESAQRGAQVIMQSGCATCHTIPGIPNADGRVGPPLSRFGGQRFIAGTLQNTHDNLVLWLKDPQAVLPGNAMPNVGLSDEEAAAVASYLETLQ